MAEDEYCLFKMQQRATLVLISTFALGGALPASAETDFSTCAVPKNVLTTKTLADIPPPILAQMPDLGAADGPIRTDALLPNDTRPTTRLAGAFSRQNLWAVVYETGGFANMRMIATFTVSDGGKQATLIGRHDGYKEGGYCAVLERVFYQSVRP